MFVSGLSTVVVATFLRICTDVSSRRPVTIYRPQCPLGYCSVGDYAQPTLAHEQNYGVTLCFRAINNSSLVAKPVGYRQIWSTEHDGYDEEYSGSGSGSGSGSSEDTSQRIVAFWRAIPPTDDYVAIGDVITTDYAQPPISAACVVHKSLVTIATGGRRVWRDISGAGSIWMTSRSHGYLDLRTFRTNDNKGPPEEFKSLILEVLPAPHDSSIIIETIGEKDLKLLYKGCEDLNIYVPQPPRGFMSLGYHARKNDPRHYHGHVTVVKELTTTYKSLLLSPTGYHKIIDHIDHCNNTVKLTYWRPIPAPGYHCMGDIVTVNQNTLPPPHTITCVHWSLVMPSQRGSRIWWNRKQSYHHSKMNNGFTLWGVGGRDSCESPNTFVAYQGFVTPPSERDLFHCIASPSIEI